MTFTAWQIENYNIYKTLINVKCSVLCYTVLSTSIKLTYQRVTKPEHRFNIYFIIGYLVNNFDLWQIYFGTHQAYF